MQCVPFEARATAGHRVNNGGNTGEILFTEIWSRLPQTLKPLRSKLLNDALTTQKPFSELQVDPSELYLAHGEPKDSSSLLAYALQLLLGCESALVPMSLKQVAEDALAYRYYREINLASETYFLQQRDEELKILTAQNEASLTEMLKERLRLQKGETVTIQEVGSSVNVNTVLVHGRLVARSRRSNFNIVFWAKEGRLEIRRADVVIY